jgi:hypothetical protein
VKDGCNALSGFQSLTYQSSPSTRSLATLLVENILADPLSLDSMSDPVELQPSDELCPAIADAIAIGSC